jgi:hypothetical protein
MLGDFKPVTVQMLAASIAIFNMDIGSEIREDQLELSILQLDTGMGWVATNLFVRKFSIV